MKKYCQNIHINTCIHIYIHKYKYMNIYIQIHVSIYIYFGELMRKKVGKGFGKRVFGISSFMERY